MKKIIPSSILVLACAGFTVSNQTIASDLPSFNFVDGYLANIEQPAISGSSRTANGLGLRASGEIGEQLYMTGQFNRASKGYDIPVNLPGGAEGDTINTSITSKNLRLGVGYYQALDFGQNMPATAIYSSLEYVSEAAVADRDALGIGVGVRSMLTRELELKLGVKYDYFNDVIGNDFYFEAGAAYRLTPAFSIIGEGSFADERETLILGGRFHF